MGKHSNEKIRIKRINGKNRRENNKEENIDNIMIEDTLEKEKSKNKKHIKLFILIITILLITIGYFIYKYDLIRKLKLVISPIEIEKIEINSENEEIQVGEEKKIDYKIEPYNYSKSNLEFISSNPEIVEFNNGKIIGKSVGQAKIYMKNNEIISNEIDINSFIKLQKVDIENKINELKIGDTYHLNLIFLPDNATNKEIKFSTSDANILSVDNTGNLQAKSLGKATINILNSKDEILNSIEIEVKKIPVSEIVIDDNNIKLGKGQNYIINSYIKPDNATYKDISYDSSNKNIITINNRIIKAIGVGNAKIIVKADNGDKKIECNVEVLNSYSTNDYKYAYGKYNIRSGASTNYKILGTTKYAEKIEFLKNINSSWEKIRTQSGIVGYVYLDKNRFLKEKPFLGYHIENVPYLNQFSLGYPTGCEAVSATMVLKYKGFNVSASNLISKLKLGSKKYQDENDKKWYGANPFSEFVGDPSKRLNEGSYGVFAKPIANAMTAFAVNRVKNISGISEKELLKYIENKNPVVVWCVKNAGNLAEGVTWNYKDGSGTFKELIGEHCSVLIGYDNDYVYLNDPSAGKNVKQNRSKFFSNWRKLYSQAIVIE